MTVKEYLGQAHNMQRRINILAQERDALMSRAQGNQSPQLRHDGGGGSGPSDRMRYVDAYVDIERRLDEAIDEYEMTRNKIVMEINALSDARHAELLYLRYIKWMRLDEIADIMRKPNGRTYSSKHIQRLHGWALAAFYKKYPNYFPKCGSNAVF